MSYEPCCVLGCIEYPLLLKDVEFSGRTRQALLSSGITTLEQLRRVSEGELLRTPNFGRKSLAEVKEFLDLYGLQLRPPLQRG